MDELEDEEEQRKQPTEPTPLTGSQFAVRAMLVLGIGLIAFVGYKSCEADRRAAEKAAKATPKVHFQGGDYHSTVFRAREHAVRKLDAVDKERREQIKEEESFDKPSPKATPQSAQP